MRRLHLLFGLLTLAAFVHSGFVLRSEFPEVYAGNESIRYLYRASHIYILLAGLLHLVLGLYFTLDQARWRRGLQILGTILLVGATVVLFVAFHFEPKDSPERRITALGIFAMAGGTVAHLLARVRWPFRGRQR